MSVTTKSTGCLTLQRTIFIELFWQIATTRAGANCSLKCARPPATAMYCTYNLIIMALRLCAWACVTCWAQWWSWWWLWWWQDDDIASTNGLANETGMVFASRSRSRSTIDIPYNIQSGSRKSDNCANSWPSSLINMQKFGQTIKLSLCRQAPVSQWQNALSHNFG